MGASLLGLPNFYIIIYLNKDLSITFIYIQQKCESWPHRQFFYGYSSVNFKLCIQYYYTIES